MTALAPFEAIAFAARLLQAEGFVMSARNERGDSLYLSLPGAPQALRVSNHARTPKQRKKHPEVVMSLVFREPKPPARIEELVAAAVRTFRAEAARRRAMDAI